jgi:hypothetical protein
VESDKSHDDHDGHGDHGHGSHGHEAHGHGEHAAKEEKFDVAKALNNKNFAHFVDAYAAAQGLRIDILAKDEARLESIHKLFEIKKKTAHELAAFYSQVLSKETGLTSQSSAELTKAFHDVEAFVDKIAYAQVPDAPKRLAELKAITNATTVTDRIKKINELGLAERYLLPDGTIDAPKIQRDVTEFAKKAKNSEAAHHRADAKKPQGKAVADQADFPDLFNIRHDIYIYNKNKNEIDEVVRLHIGEETDPGQARVKLLKRHSELVSVLGEASGGKRAKMVKELGLDDRYTKDVSNKDISWKDLLSSQGRKKWRDAFSTFNFSQHAIDNDLIDKDLDLIRNALAELGVKNTGVVEKQQQLEKIKQNFLNLKVASGTVFEAAKQTLRHNIEDLVNHGPAVGRELEEIQQEEEQDVEKEPVYTAWKAMLETDLRNRQEAYKTQSDALETLKKAIAEARKEKSGEAAEVEAITKHIQELERGAKDEKVEMEKLQKEVKKLQQEGKRERMAATEKIQKQSQRVEKMRADIESANEALQKLRGALREKEKDYAERAKDLEAAVKELGNAGLDPERRGELKVFVVNERQRLAKEAEEIKTLHDEIARGEKQLLEQGKNLDEAAEQLENQKAELEEMIMVQEGEEGYVAALIEDREEQQNAREATIEKRKRELGEHPLTKKEAYIEQETLRLAEEKKAVDLLVSQYAEAEKNIAAMRAARAARKAEAEKGGEELLGTIESVTKMKLASRDYVPELKNKVAGSTVKDSIEKVKADRKKLVERKIDVFIERLITSPRSADEENRALDGLKLKPSEKSTVLKEKLQKAKQKKVGGKSLSITTVNLLDDLVSRVAKSAK